MREPPAIKDLSGEWRRSLLELDDGRSDTSSHVRWLQGPSLFCDLRQAVPRPIVDAVYLRALSIDAIASLSTQEGFAGRFIRDGRVFEWVRWVDYQPPLVVKDRATLTWQGDVLIETGQHNPYIEHWHRDRGQPSETSAFHLHDPATGRTAILTVASDRFAFARERGIPLDAGRILGDLVLGSPTLAMAQDLIDCEISQGSIDGWIIQRSTLPWRVGKSLNLSREGPGVALDDVDPEGRACRRSYDMLEEEHS